jgi:hypothetical protein
MPNLAFPQALPKSGEQILVEEKPYRIAQVSEHSHSSLLTLSLSSVDE